MWVELSHSVIEKGLHAPEAVGYLAVSEPFVINTSTY
jgi:hypothetical protein